MHPHEAQIVRTFFVREKRERYLAMLGGSQRPKALGRLNHFHDLDERWSRIIESPTDVLSLLRELGALGTCYVLSDIPEIDGRDMPLAEAIGIAEVGNWGTIIGCIPGKLAYYRGEASQHGTRRLLLERRR